MSTKLNSHQVKYDDGTVQDVLDSAKPMANYAALRAYTGRATIVRIAEPGIAGFFRRNGSAADNGGTVIKDALNRSWERVFEGSIFPEWFGADTASSTNADAIQAAADFAASTRKGLYIGQTFEAERPIYIPAFSRWGGGGRIKNVYSGPNAQLMLAILPGNYNPAYYAGLAYTDCNSTSSGQRFIVCSTPANASDFASGDPIYVRSAEKYFGFGAVDIPLYGALNRVVSSNASTGIIELEYPLLEGITTAKIAKANNSTPDILGLRNLYVCHDSIIDGVSIESVNGHALERGGALGCNFYFPEIRGKSGIFTNAICFSKIRVDRIDCDVKAIDIAGNSVGSDFEIGTVAYRKTLRSVSGELISLNESAWHLRVNINSFGADDWDYPSQVLTQFAAANNCKVEIAALACEKNSGSAIFFWNVLRGGVGETQNSTRGNSFEVGQLNAGSALQRFVFFQNDGGLLSSNKVIVQRGLGAASNGAVTFAGSFNRVFGNFQAGDISFGASTDCRAEVVTPGASVGLTRGSKNTLMLNNVEFMVAPRVKGGVVVAPATINGGGGASSYTPALLAGSVHSIAFTSTTAFAINKALNVVAGDEWTLEVLNSNGVTTITPSFDSNYVAPVVTPISATKRALFTFTAITSARILVKEVLTGY